MKVVTASIKHPKGTAEARREASAHYFHAIASNDLIAATCWADQVQLINKLAVTQTKIYRKKQIARYLNSWNLFEITAFERHHQRALLLCAHLTPKRSTKWNFFFRIWIFVSHSCKKNDRIGFGWLNAFAYRRKICALDDDWMLKQKDCGYGNNRYIHKLNDQNGLESMSLKQLNCSTASSHCPRRMAKEVILKFIAQK